MSTIVAGLQLNYANVCNNKWGEKPNQAPLLSAVNPSKQREKGAEWFLRIAEVELTGLISL
mgnify:CR=1 FL=1